MKCYKFSLFTFLIFFQLNAQLLDTATPIEFEETPILLKTSTGFLVESASFNFSSPLSIEGAALRFSGNIKSRVWVQYVFESDSLSPIYKTKLFSEPGSNRFIASILKKSETEVFRIRYRAESSEEIKLLSGGIYTAFESENKSDNFISPLMPKRNVTDKPKIISRSEWGAKSPKYDYSNHPYFNKMTLHHAAGWGAKTLEEGKAAVKSIQDFHQNGRGWSDIGYHFLVDMAGNIYQGRPETVLGAHVGGANTGNIGVCLLGCYHPPETSIPCYDEMSYSSEQSLIKLYAWISDTYGVEPKLLKGHRDYFGTTSCPGNNVWSMLPNLRSEISLFIMYGFQPTRFALFQNYPNPFNATTTLHYDLPEPSKVSITIYDILGNEVIRLIDTDQHYGYKKIVWNGQNANGNLVSPGVYFFKAELGPLTETRKMTLLK